MDLIEVLWKQDVDLGFSLELARQEEQLKDKAVDVVETLKNDTDASTSLLIEKEAEEVKAKNEKVKVCDFVSYCFKLDLINFKLAPHLSNVTKLFSYHSFYISQF